MVKVKIPREYKRVNSEVLRKYDGKYVAIWCVNPDSINVIYGGRIQVVKRELPLYHAKPGDIVLLRYESPSLNDIVLAKDGKLVLGSELYVKIVDRSDIFLNRTK